MEIYENGERVERNKGSQCDERQFLYLVWHQLPQDFGLQKVGFKHMKSLGVLHSARGSHN